MLSIMLAFTLLQIPYKINAQPFAPNWHRTTMYNSTVPSEWRNEQYNNGIATRHNTSSLAAPNDYCWTAVGTSYTNTLLTPVNAAVERVCALDASGDPVFNTLNAYSIDFTNFYNTFGQAIAENPVGPEYGYVTAGYLRGVGTAVSAGVDGYYSFMNTTGNVSGAIRLSTPGNDYITDIIHSKCLTCPDPNTWLITGYTTGTAPATMPFIARVNAAGIVEWAYHYSLDLGGLSLSTRSNSIAEHSSGRIFICGSVADGLDKDAMLMCVGSDGSFYYANSYGTAGVANEEFRSILVSDGGTGNIVTTGWSLSSLTLQPIIWAADFDPSGVNLNSKLISFNNLFSSGSAGGGAENLLGHDIKQDLSGDGYFINATSKILGLPDIYNVVAWVDNSFSPNRFIKMNKVSAADNFNLDLIYINASNRAFCSFTNDNEVAGSHARNGFFAKSTENYQVCGDDDAFNFVEENYAFTTNALGQVSYDIFTTNYMKVAQYPAELQDNCPTLRLANSNSTINEPTTITSSLVANDLQLLSTYQSIQLVDMSGRAVYVSTSAIDVQTIDCSKFNNGLYLLHLTNLDSTISIQKIIIQHK
jgi:hypothetical protein